MKRRHFCNFCLASMAPYLSASVKAYAQDASAKRTDPYFVCRCPVWNGIAPAFTRSPFSFGKDEAGILAAINAAFAAGADQKLTAQRLPNREPAAIARLIRSAVMATPAWSTSNAFCQDWLMAEGVCAWVRFNLRYDYAWASALDRVNGWGGVSEQEKTRRTTSDPILALSQPTATCWGTAIVTRDLARLSGLKCDFVNGNVRGLGKPTPAQKDRNHGTVCFIFPGGIKVPADVTALDTGKLPERTRKTRSDCVLPRHAEAWELFLAKFNADIGEAMIISGDPQNRHKLMTLSYADWAAHDTRSLLTLEEANRRWEMSR